VVSYGFVVVGEHCMVAGRRRNRASRRRHGTLSGGASVRALGLPAAYPTDPADRVIGGTALVEGLVLLTADRAIRRSRALHTIW
jgi:predicted nucleic acid-binding protein